MQDSDGDEDGYYLSRPHNLNSKRNSIRKNSVHRSSISNDKNNKKNITNFLGTQNYEESDIGEIFSKSRRSFTLETNNHPFEDDVFADDENMTKQFGPTGIEESIQVVEDPFSEDWTKEEHGNTDVVKQTPSKMNDEGSNSTQGYTDMSENNTKLTDNINSDKINEENTSNNECTMEEGSSTDGTVFPKTDTLPSANQQDSNGKILKTL